MGKRLLIFAIFFLSLLAFTIWLAQPPFRLRRKLLAKLPYAPQRLLITDLDDDGHPEVMAILEDKPSGFASRLTNLLAFALKMFRQI
jgi:hypothetical protein